MTHYDVWFYKTHEAMQCKSFPSRERAVNYAEFISKYRDVCWIDIWTDDRQLEVIKVKQ